jgi:hypothetical protein
MVGNNNRFYIDLNGQYCFKETGECSSLVFQPGKIISYDQFISEKLMVSNLPSFILQKNFDWDICRVDIEDEVPTLPSWVQKIYPDNKSGYVQKARMLYRLVDWNVIVANKFSLECAKRIISIAKILRKVEDQDYDEALELMHTFIELLITLDSSRKDRETDVWKDSRKLMDQFYQSNHPIIDKVDSITERIKIKSNNLPPWRHINIMLLALLSNCVPNSAKEVAYNARIIYAWINQLGVSGKENDVKFIENQINELYVQTDIFRKLVHEEEF